MNVKKVKIVDLVNADHNPKERSVKNLTGLMKSLEKIGLQYPVLVTKDNVIIDGHRRVAAAKELGWEEIPVLVSATADVNTVYADVNATARKISSVQNLRIYLKNPDAVTAVIRERFDEMENVCGRKLLISLAKQGASLDYYKAAKAVRKYVGSDDEDFLLAVLTWLVEHRNIINVRAYIKMMRPARTLLNAIKKGRDLSVRFA